MQIAVTPDQYATYHPEGIAAREAAEAAEFTFLDLVDVVNPLQHIPVVNMVYREVTGDTIKGPAMIVGGFLYGGPLGMGAGMVNAVALEATGGTLTDHALDVVFGGDRVNPLSSEQLYAVFGDPNADPATADLLATAQRAPTPEEIRARTAEIAAIARGLPEGGDVAVLPTQAELTARTAQVAAVARQLAGEAAGPSGQGVVAAIPSMPTPPSRPATLGSPPAAEPAPAAQSAAAADAPTVRLEAQPAPPFAPDVPPGASPAPDGGALPVPSLALTLPALADPERAGQFADSIPATHVPPPPEAFMALPARVPAAPSRMATMPLAQSPLPSAPAASPWLAQEIVASIDAALAQAPPATGREGSPASDEAMAADEDGVPPGGEPPPALAPLPPGAVPAAMMRNLDAYRSMAQSAS